MKNNEYKSVNHDCAIRYRHTGAVDEIRRKRNRIYNLNDSDNRPSFFGNNEELMDIAYVQVHFFTPNNPKSTAKKIRKKLRQAGFTYLSTTEIYEETTKLFHTIIEVMIEGISETQMEDY